MRAKRLPKEIGADELLARYILFGSHLRKDQTVRPDAFIPHPYPDLSVTRHIGLTESTIWELGRDVAAQRQLTLHARADVKASHCIANKLTVSPQPLRKTKKRMANPNHANIAGWPADKPSQKIIALELSAAAGKAKTPPQET